MRVWWKGHWRSMKRWDWVGGGDWDSCAGRERGGLCVLSSGMSFYLSPKGDQNTATMEEILSMLILNVLQVVEGRS